LDQRFPQPRLGTLRIRCSATELPRPFADLRAARGRVCHHGPFLWAGSFRKSSSAATASRRRSGLRWDHWRQQQSAVARRAGERARLPPRELLRHRLASGKPELRDTVLLPFLDDQYGRIAEAQQLGIELSEERRQRERRVRGAGVGGNAGVPRHNSRIQTLPPREPMPQRRSSRRRVGRQRPASRVPDCN
jgi:hypothetical protein